MSPYSAPDEKVRDYGTDDRSWRAERREFKAAIARSDRSLEALTTPVASRTVEPAHAGFPRTT